MPQLFLCLEPQNENRPVHLSSVHAHDNLMINLWAKLKVFIIWYQTRQDSLHHICLSWQTSIRDVFLFLSSLLNVPPSFAHSASKIKHGYNLCVRDVYRIVSLNSVIAAGCRPHWAKAARDREVVVFCVCVCVARVLVLLRNLAEAHQRILYAPGLCDSLGAV